jgi:hypothetical protein
MGTFRYGKTSRKAYILFYQNKYSGVAAETCDAPSWPLMATHQDIGLNGANTATELCPPNPNELEIPACQRDSSSSPLHQCQTAREGAILSTALHVCIDSSPLTDVYLVPLFHPTHRVKFINCRLRILQSIEGEKGVFSQNFSKFSVTSNV